MPEKYHAVAHERYHAVAHTVSCRSSVPLVVAVVFAVVVELLLAFRRFAEISCVMRVMHKPRSIPFICLCSKAASTTCMVMLLTWPLLRKLTHSRSIFHVRNITMMVVEAVLEHRQMQWSDRGWYMTRHDHPADEDEDDDGRMSAGGSVGSETAVVPNVDGGVVGTETTVVVMPGPWNADRGVVGTETTVVVSSGPWNADRGVVGTEAGSVATATSRSSM
jgi:hypothetical protein